MTTPRPRRSSHQPQPLSPADRTAPLEVACELSRRTPALALLALSTGGFGIGLTEFIIAGLLTEVGSDLYVSISAAGHFVGAYALAVVPGALIITPMLMRRTPKLALVILLAPSSSGASCPPGHRTTRSCWPAALPPHSRMVATSASAPCLPLP